MELSLSDIAEEDRGLLSPCGIICGGCDVYTNESVDAAKTIIQIWEGFNLADVPMLAKLTSQEVLTVIDNLKKFIEHRESADSCPGCHPSGGPLKMCPIWKCVKAKGYLTCAECDEYKVDSESPCPHFETDHPDVLLPSKGKISNLVCKRYKSNNVENLRKCRDLGYPAFVEETKKRLRKGWRTWQVISNEMVVSKKI